MINIVGLLLLLATLDFPDVNDPNVRSFIQSIEAKTPLSSFSGKYRHKRYIVHMDETEEFDVELQYSGNNIFQRSKKVIADENGLYSIFEGYFFQNSPAFVQYRVRESQEMFMSPTAFLGSAVDFIWPFRDQLSPRRVLGELGHAASGPVSGVHGLPLIDFLKKEGPYWYDEKDGYRILSHEARIGDRIESYDIWLDPYDDIVRIEQRFRPWNATPELMARYNVQAFDEFSNLRRTIDLGEYFTVADGVRFPTSATMYWYSVPDEFVQEYESMASLFESPAHAQMARMVMLHDKETLFSKSSVDFNIDLCAFNETIDNAIFKPQLPVGTEYQQESKGEFHTIEPTPPALQRIQRWTPALIIVFAVVILTIAGRYLLKWRW